MCTDTCASEGDILGGTGGWRLLGPCELTNILFWQILNTNWIWAGALEILLLLRYIPSFTISRQTRCSTSSSTLVLCIIPWTQPPLIKYWPCSPNFLLKLVMWISAFYNPTIVTKHLSQTRIFVQHSWRFVCNTNFYPPSDISTRWKVFQGGVRQKSRHNWNFKVQLQDRGAQSSDLTKWRRRGKVASAERDWWS